MAGVREEKDLWHRRAKIKDKSKMFVGCERRLRNNGRKKSFLWWRKMEKTGCQTVFDADEKKKRESVGLRKRDVS